MTAATIVPAVEAEQEPAAARTKQRPGRKGTLRIRSRPACDIIIDGRKTGLRTPQRSLELKPGKHTIVLVNKKHRIRKKLSVRIKEGKTTRVTKDLRRDRKD